MRPAGKTYLSGRRVAINSHRAGGGRNRPHPVTRHRNTGCCSERVARFLCGLHDPLWLRRTHYVLARISRKCRCAKCEREHDTCASNRRTAQATKPVSYSHAVIVIPLRILRKLIYRLFKTKKRHFQHCELFTDGFPHTYILQSETNSRPFYTVRPVGRDIAGLKASSFAGASNVRLDDRKSVTDYAHRRIIDQSARCRLPPRPVDFMAVNNSNRRDRLGTYWLQFNTLWNKRTGDENRPLFDFLLTLRSSVARGLGKDRSSKHAGHDENCSAGTCQRLHKLTYSREGAARKLSKR